MRSMTGYGCGESVHDGCKVTVELSSVNRKQTELSVNLPRDLEVLEAQLRDRINQQLSRGRITVRVSLHVSEGRQADRVRINRKLAQAYAREFAHLAEDLRLEGRPSLDLVLRSPGVLETHEEVEDAEAFWPAVSKALDRALKQLIGMREKEGAHLARDLRARLRAMRRAAAIVRKSAPEVATRHREQLLARARAVGVEWNETDQERLLKEVALFADRSDITEELTRLESHFGQLQECLQGTEPVGRTLDFIAQEMNREINTIGSKANDATIARHVVSLKAELEKIREQAQNVE